MADKKSDSVAIPSKVVPQNTNLSASPSRNAKHGGFDRHSGISKSPKKGGAGKGGWGTVMDDLKGEADGLDEAKADETYKEFDDVEYQVIEVDDPHVVILREFLRSGDLEDLIKTIEEMVSMLDMVAFIRKALQLSMEHNSYERELTSKMLSELHVREILLDKKTFGGFQRALDALADDVLDIPQAVAMMAKFIARAIVDEVLPLNFPDCVELRTPQAAEAVALARGMTNAPHFGERLSHIWGPGDQASVKRLLEEVVLIVEEYLQNEDCADAAASIRRLNARSFHFQFVEQHNSKTWLNIKQQEAIKIVCEKESTAAKVLNLLTSLRKRGILSAGQVEEGFKRAEENMNDIKLDAPNAPKVLFSLRADAEERALLEKTSS